MERLASTAPKVGPLGLRTPGLVFLLCLVLTALATAFVAYSERQAERVRFDNAVIAARERIDVRMEGYVALLRGSAAGLAPGIDTMSADDFRVFVERLDLGDNYPGTLGVGYSIRFGDISPREATERARAAGWNDVRVWPETPRPEVHAIVALEPRNARNRAALGYDMSTEPVRREAMERARDEGEPALSGKVTLVQEIETEKQPGFLLYAPVYAEGVVTPTVEQRRDKLVGYIYAPLRAGDLFTGIFGDAVPTVGFELHDGHSLDASTLLYTFGMPSPSHEVVVERIVIAGREWTVRFMRRDGPWRTFRLAIGAAVFGMVLSGLVFAVMIAREKGRARELRAEASAQMSADMLRFTELFVGVLGHDLRTPLGAISMGSQLLLREHGDDPATATLAKRILESSRRMGRMINQILDLTNARLAGGIPVAAKPIDLGAVALDMIDELERGLPGCHVRVETTGDLQGTWDPDRLAQVFSNLLGNAARHADGEPVRVELLGADPDRVVATVHNAGVIPKAMLRELFEPFRSGGRTAGLGLGLYITKSIVEAHEGTLEVTSAEGAGTTFTVTLPR